jgi:glutamate racemase
LFARLIENKCRVLIAACDTFRAGAVEQLRTHMRRLNSLHPQADGSKQSGKSVGKLSSAEKIVSKSRERVVSGREKKNLWQKVITVTKKEIAI